MDENIAIKVENLTKTYPIYNSKNDRMKEAFSLTRKKYHKDFNALNNISVEIKRGESIGIIGQNGSGKSTLLKILTGILSPTSGSAQVNGKVSALLELGAGFNPEMTGMENIYLNGTIMGYTKEEMEKRVPKIVTFADIGDFIGQPVKTYSSGMFARLAFAVAINVEPDILIIDEALSVGDTFFQNKCFHKLEELRKSRITIIFVSHDLSSIKQMCDKVLWLDKGQKISFGDKNKVCTEYHATLLKKNNLLFRQVINPKKIDIECGKSEKTFPKIQIKEGDVLSEELEIKSFFICDKEENITTNLLVNERYGIHVVCKSKKEFKNSIFGITLENSKGIVVAAFNSYVNNAQSSIMLKKNTITDVALDFYLPKIQKGEYLMSVAIAEGIQESHKNITWLYNNLKILVDNPSYNVSLYEFDINFSVVELLENKVTFI